MRHLPLLLLAVSAFAAAAQAAADYALPAPVRRLVADPAAFATFARDLPAEVERLLDATPRDDQPRLKLLLGMQVHLAIRGGDDERALAAAARIRDLQPTPELRAYAGLTTRAMVAAHRLTGRMGGDPGYVASFGREFSRLLAGLPPSAEMRAVLLVQRERAAGTTEAGLRSVAERLDRELDGARHCTLEQADAIIRLHHRRHDILPLGAAMVKALDGVLARRDAALPARFLFLDPGLLADSRNVTLMVQPARRRETVIVTNRPWESLMISLYATVIDDNGRLRLWYICRDKENQANVAYAESVDGVHWAKPNLGIVEYGGSRENNLVGLTSLEGAVFKDSRGSALERYIYLTHVRDGIVRYHSPDGLSWQRDAAPLLKYGSDTQNVVFWDTRLQRYALYFRGWDVAGPTAVRTVMRTTFPDLVHPVEVPPAGVGRRVGGDSTGLKYAHDEFPVVLRCDEEDPSRTDFYNLSVQPYPVDPSWYVAFPSLLRRSVESWKPDARGPAHGPVEAQFAGSRDGISWQRYDRAAYAPPGTGSPDDRQMVFMATGLVVRGDEIWQYGIEFATEHGDIAARQRNSDGVIARYVQRIDGFVALTAGNAAGWSRTVPVRVTGRQLLLNLDADALGEARVGLVGKEGLALPGFGLDDCEPLQANATGVVVKWKGGSDLSSLDRREVALEFSLLRTKLYSFRFE